MNHAPQVGIDGALPEFHGNVLERQSRADARIVEDEIQMTLESGRLIDQRLDL